MRLRGPLIRGRSDGRFDVRLERTERQLLRSLVPQVAELLSAEDLPGSNDVAVGRLFPVAYAESRDADRETEYRLLVHDELRASHLAALTALAQSADARVVDAEQLGAWMRAVNAIRLILGTRLGVTEEGDERAGGGDVDGFAVYDYLSWLTDEIVGALAPGVQPSDESVGEEDEPPGGSEPWSPAEDPGEGFGPTG